MRIAGGANYVSPYRAIRSLEVHANIDKKSVAVN